MSKNIGRDLNTDPDPTCDVCNEIFEGWYIRDDLWAMVPEYYHYMFLCCKCYLIVREREQ